jgi:putative protein-disulfide isomerase
MDEPPVELLYVFDPLCGWCYGAAPAVQALARDPACTLELLPSGLFAGAPTRRIDPAFAAHVEEADARIERLTGQPFSQRYREQVVHNPRLPFDSQPATEALEAVRRFSPAHELAALHAIQHARYVEGEDVANRQVLAEVLASVFAADRDVAVQWSSPAFWRLELASPSLPAEVAVRVERARRVMQAVGARGVPLLVLSSPEGLRAVPQDVLFGRVPPAEALARWRG